MVVSTVMQTHCGAECAILAYLLVIWIFMLFYSFENKIEGFFFLVEKGFGTEMNNISGIF